MLRISVSALGVRAGEWVSILNLARFLGPICSFISASEALWGLCGLFIYFTPRRHFLSWGTLWGNE